MFEPSPLRRPLDDYPVDEPDRNVAVRTVVDPEEDEVAGGCGRLALAPARTSGVAPPARVAASRCADGETADQPTELALEHDAFELERSGTSADPEPGRLAAPGVVVVEACFATLTTATIELRSIYGSPSASVSRLLSRLGLDRTDDARQAASSSPSSGSFGVVRVLAGAAPFLLAASDVDESSVHLGGFLRGLDHAEAALAVDRFACGDLRATLLANRAGCSSRHDCSRCSSLGFPPGQVLARAGGWSPRSFAAFQRGRLRSCAASPVQRPESSSEAPRRRTGSAASRRRALARAAAAAKDPCRPLRNHDLVVLPRLETAFRADREHALLDSHIDRARVHAGQIKLDMNSSPRR